MTTGTIIACVIGILISVGMIVGTTILSKQNKIKTLQKIMFYALGSGLLILSIASFFIK